jgi:hypothetical protein
MVLDSKSSVTIPLELGIWLVCTAIALATYFGKTDIGAIGILMWIVFIGGIIFFILKIFNELF